MTPSKKKKALDADLFMIKEHCRIQDDCKSFTGDCVLEDFCKDRHREPYKWLGVESKKIPIKLRRAILNVAIYCSDQKCASCLITELCESRSDSPEQWPVDKTKD